MPTEPTPDRAEHIERLKQLRSLVLYPEDAPALDAAIASLQREGERDDRLARVLSEGRLIGLRAINDEHGPFMTIDGILADCAPPEEPRPEVCPTCGKPPGERGRVNRWADAGALLGYGIGRGGRREGAGSPTEFDDRIDPRCPEHGHLVDPVPELARAVPQEIPRIGKRPRPSAEEQERAFRELERRELERSAPNPTPVEEALAAAWRCPTCGRLFDHRDSECPDECNAELVPVAASQINPTELIQVGPAPTPPSEGARRAIKEHDIVYVRGTVVMPPEGGGLRVEFSSEDGLCLASLTLPESLCGPASTGLPEGEGTDE